MKHIRDLPSRPGKDTIYTFPNTVHEDANGSKTTAHKVSGGKE